MDPKRFLNDVWSEQGEGFGFICCRRSPTSWFDRAVKYPEQFDSLELWDAEEGDTYFSPNLFARPKRRNELVLPSRWLYADLDQVNPAGVDERLAPTVAWRSSDDRYQGLWLVQPLERDIHQQLNKQLTYKLDADRSGWDSSQVLRLPGTLNHKYQPSQPVSLMWWRGKQLRVRGSGMPIASSQSGPQLRAVELDGKVVPTWARSRLRATRANGDRSRVLFRIECELLNAGFTRDEVFTLVRPTVWNKFDDAGLSAEIHRVAGRFS